MTNRSPCHHPLTLCSSLRSILLELSHTVKKTSYQTSSHRDCFLKGKVLQWNVSGLSGISWNVIPSRHKNLALHDVTGWFKWLHVRVTEVIVCCWYCVVCSFFFSFVIKKDRVHLSHFWVVFPPRFKRKTLRKYVLQKRREAYF